MFKKRSGPPWHGKNWKSQIFVLFENEASCEDLLFCFFAHKCFKSCYGYFVTFSVKVWSKEANGYRSNILLLLYQYVILDVFFRKSIIEIQEINPWRTNSSINGSREWAFTEMVEYFSNIRTKIRNCYEIWWNMLLEVSIDWNHACNL